MIALFFAWILFAFVVYSYGVAGIRFFELIWKDEKSWNFLDTVLIGMCIVTSVIALFHLIIPADTNLLFILILTALIYWFFTYKQLMRNAQKAFDIVWSIPKAYILLFGCFIVIFALFCSLYPRMTDTLYYHYQNLMWNDQYAIVPGLGNLQPRFAFNSNVFLLGSTFGLYAIFKQFIFSVHTFLLTAITIWVTYKSLIGKASFRKAFTLFIFVTFFVIYKIHITSITSDFLANLLAMYLFLNLFYDPEAIRRKSLLYLLLPIFIVTIKLSCAPVLLFSLYAFYLRCKDVRQIEKGSIALPLLTLFIAGAFILLPWCLGTYIMSGYLFFPIPYLDFFNPDWKIPMHYLMEQKEFIQAFAKYPNNLDIKSILAMPITEWFPVWWRSDMFYYNPIANRFFFFATLLAIPIGGWMCYKTRKQYPTLILSWFISLITIVIWFSNAPDFRFVYAFILNLAGVTIFLALNLYRYKITTYKKLKKNNIYAKIIALTIIFVLIFSARWIHFQRGKDVNLIDIINQPTPISYKKEKDRAGKYMVMEVNGMKINRRSPSDEALLCYDYELPASADFVGGIQMRGETLQNGFRCLPDAPKRLTY